MTSQNTSNNASSGTSSGSSGNAGGGYTYESSGTNSQVGHSSLSLSHCRILTLLIRATTTALVTMVPARATTTAFTTPTLRAATTTPTPTVSTDSLVFCLLLSQANTDVRQYVLQFRRRVQQVHAGDRQEIKSRDDRLSSLAETHRGGNVVEQAR